MPRKFVIPCSNILDMVISADWVDFIDKKTEIPFACWDVQQKSLTVYTNPSVTVENVTNLAGAIRSMIKIEIN